MRVSRRLLLGLAPALALDACSSAEPVYYTLSARPGTPRRGKARSLELRRVTLAGYLDRTAIVRSAANYRLAVASNERWGEPLADLVARVLAENLVQRLPDATVVTEAGALSVDTDLLAEIDVQRLDADAEGRVVLLAQMAVRPRFGRRTGVTRTLRLEVAPAGAATADFAAAVSTALGQLADALADAAMRA